jgi:hypothetical protein
LLGQSDVMQNILKDTARALRTHRWHLRVQRAEYVF